MATKQEILEYVMNTPGNTNPNVLGPMLESISGITPTGEISIASNGEHDVTNYASANVNVSSSPDLSKQTTDFDIYTNGFMEGVHFIFSRAYSANYVGIDGRADALEHYTATSSSSIINTSMSRFKSIEPIIYGRILVIGTDLSEYQLDFSNSDDYYDNGCIYVKLNGKRHTLAILSK